MAEKTTKSWSRIEIMLIFGVVFMVLCVFCLLFYPLGDGEDNGLKDKKEYNVSLVVEGSGNRAYVNYSCLNTVRYTFEVVDVPWIKTFNCISKYDHDVHIYANPYADFEDVNYVKCKLYVDGQLKDRDTFYSQEKPNRYQANCDWSNE